MSIQNSSAWSRNYCISKQIIKASFSPKCFCSLSQRTWEQGDGTRCISTCNSGSNQDLLEFSVEEAGVVGGSAASTELLHGPGLAAAGCAQRLWGLRETLFIMPTEGGTRIDICQSRMWQFVAWQNDCEKEKIDGLTRGKGAVRRNGRIEEEEWHGCHFY